MYIIYRDDPGDIKNVSRINSLMKYYKPTTILTEMDGTSDFHFEHLRSSYKVKILSFIEKYIISKLCFNGRNNKNITSNNMFKNIKLHKTYMARRIGEFLRRFWQSKLGI